MSPCCLATLAMMQVGSSVLSCLVFSHMSCKQPSLYLIAPFCQKDCLLLHNSQCNCKIWALHHPPVSKLCVPNHEEQFPCHHAGLLCMSSSCTTLRDVNHFGREWKVWNNLFSSQVNSSLDMHHANLCTSGCPSSCPSICQSSCCQVCSRLDCLCYISTYSDLLYSL